MSHELLPPLPPVAPDARRVTFSGGGVEHVVDRHVPPQAERAITYIDPDGHEMQCAAPAPEVASQDTIINLLRQILAELRAR